ncbi:MAG: hypothetical protein ABIN90_03160 [Knoellia sp.]
MAGPPLVVRGLLNLLNAESLELGIGWALASAALRFKCHSHAQTRKREHEAADVAAGLGAIGQVGNERLTCRLGGCGHDVVVDPTSVERTGPVAVPAAFRVVLEAQVDVGDSGCFCREGRHHEVDVRQGRPW